MGASLAVAFGLMWILEGLLPWLAPASWREAFSRLASMADGQIRFAGLASMLAGVLILLLV